MSDEMDNFQVEDENTGELTEYTAEELIAAHRGDYGEGWQEWAVQVIDLLDAETDYFEEDGVDLDQEFEELEAQEPPENASFEETDGQRPWEREFLAEMDIKTGRLEKQIGRKLTAGEMDAIVADVLPQGHVPDLVEAYGPQLAGRETDTEHTRRDLMTEELEDRMDRDPSFNQEPREPENVDEARRAYMTEELERGQAEEPVEA
jgi:hypothetical protein